VWFRLFSAVVLSFSAPGRELSAAEGPWLLQVPDLRAGCRFLYVPWPAVSASPSLFPWRRWLRRGAVRAFPLRLLLSSRPNCRRCVSSRSFFALHRFPCGVPPPQLRSTLTSHAIVTASRMPMCCRALFSSWAAFVYVPMRTPSLCLRLPAARRPLRKKTRFARVRRTGAPFPKPAARRLGAVSALLHDCPCYLLQMRCEIAVIFLFSSDVEILPSSPSHSSSEHGRDFPLFCLH